MIGSMLWTFQRLTCTDSRAKIWLFFFKGEQRPIGVFEGEAKTMLNSLVYLDCIRIAH